MLRRDFELMLDILTKNQMLPQRQLKIKVKIKDKQI